MTNGILRGLAAAAVAAAIGLSATPADAQVRYGGYYGGNSGFYAGGNRYVPYGYTYTPYGIERSYVVPNPTYDVYRFPGGYTYTPRPVYSTGYYSGVSPSFGIYGSPYTGFQPGVGFSFR